jgi:cation diffusion facilitator family transporter
MLTETNTPLQQETQRRVHAVKVAIAVSFAVCIVEIGLGLLRGLESLLAEGVHTFLDGVDSIIVLAAVWMAARPADRSHQYGHGKFEALGATIEGSFIVAAAIGIAYRAVGRLIRGELPPPIPLYVCVAMTAAAVLYWFVSLYLMRVARQTKSPAILAEALHLRTHIYITAGVAGGLLIGALGDWPMADTLLAIGIALCLIGISWHIFREVFRQFTDEALPDEEIEQIGSMVNEFAPRFVEVHGLRTRQSGAERHIEMHLVVVPQTTVAQAHELSHEIEAAITTTWPTSRITVHIEPFNTDNADQADWFRNQPKVRTNDDSPDEREFIH